GEGKGGRVVGGPGEDPEMGQLGAPVEALVPEENGRRILGARGRHEQNAAPAGEPEHVLEQRVIRVAAHAEDPRLGHNAEYCRAFVRRSTPWRANATSMTSTSRPTADASCSAARGSALRR